MNVVIGIGFGGIEDGAYRATFYSQVSQVITRLGTLVAVMRGESWSPEWGQERGAWFAAEFPDFDTYVEARARILAIGGTYKQDAIAFTVGTVDVAECPETTRARDA